MKAPFITGCGYYLDTRFVRVALFSQCSEPCCCVQFLPPAVPIRTAGPMPQCALAVKIRPTTFTRDIWVVCTEFGQDASGQEQLQEMQELVWFCIRCMRLQRAC